jgi:hypothetical protein
VLSIELARRLDQAGLTWSPARGDRFVVPDRDIDDEVFVISDFTVELQDRPSGPVLGFNGTTEWALDSVRIGEVLWLPREDQLRDRLGPRFRRLEATSSGWAVVVDDGQGETAYEDEDVESAYARALLAGLPSSGRPRLVAR